MEAQMQSKMINGNLIMKYMLLHFCSLSCGGRHSKSWIFCWVTSSNGGDEEKAQ